MELDPIGILTKTLTEIIEDKIEDSGMNKKKKRDVSVDQIKKIYSDFIAVHLEYIHELRKAQIQCKDKINNNKDLNIKDIISDLEAMRFNKEEERRIIREDVKNLIHDKRTDPDVIDFLRSIEFYFRPFWNQSIFRDPFNMVDEFDLRRKELSEILASTSYTGIIFILKCLENKTFDPETTNARIDHLFTAVINSLQKWRDTIKKEYDKIILS